MTATVMKVAPTSVCHGMEVPIMIMLAAILVEVFLVLTVVCWPGLRRAFAAWSPRGGGVAPARGVVPGADSGGGSCSVDGTSCSAIDPVNDPDYNMRNVVKQSILLEEHLAEPNKYCEACIVKHFLHIVGLIEEAVWLAGSNVGKYPLLADGAAFYDAQFEKWRAARKDPDVVREVLEKLRERRRAMVEAYFLK